MGTKSVKPVNHETRQHALLSASGASRWIACPPSAKLEDELGPQEASVYAKEGTVAHELAELYILKDLGRIDEESFNVRLEELMANELFNDEMLEVVPTYVDYCLAEYRAAQEANPMATIEIEQRLDLTEFVPESFGTADCIIINDDVMEVIDYKHGKGVPVFAEANKQEMLYGLGALRKFDTLYDISEIKLTIVQPRINNISTWQISVEDLLKWANEELAPAAKLAYEGTGTFKSGPHCKFCKIKNMCRRLALDAQEVAKFEFQEPALLTDDEIAEVLETIPKLTEWANSVCEYAKEQAINGKVYKGFKLVEGLSKRKWLDEDKVAEKIFAKMPELSEDQIYDMKLKTITQIEKLVGKKRFADLLSDVVIKPQGAPTLVPLSDKRPAMGISEAVNDFS